MSGNAVLTMYDIRGIQRYIFRTTKVRDAVGASALVENIIMEALETAAEKAGFGDQADVGWYDENGALPYHEEDKKIQVLFIGGGNAYVRYESREICLAVNRYMAKYILESTYSLQLAVAVVPMTGNYRDDYQRLRDEMDRVKADLAVSGPYGALPVMRAERGTGYPITFSENGEGGGTETRLKQERRRGLNDTEADKIMEQLAEKKGVDSTLAVIHIDGNSMGKRIQEMIGGITDYSEAINLMRRISYSIRSSFNQVFDQMQKTFDKKCKELPIYKEKEVKLFIRKILVAGDDITYVCSGKIGLATVEYFCKHISGFTMTGETDASSVRRDGFSVCAGVAFVNSHFPFDAAYAVAEACCGEAKARAKLPANVMDGKVLNFVDFQMCKNIQVKDLDTVRRKEYETYTGERLLNRPYYISTESDGEMYEKLEKESYSFDRLKEAVRYFQDSDQIPASHAMALRNTYPLGRLQVEQLQAFLLSRNIRMPDGSGEMYENGTAKWYDSLELRDSFLVLEDIMKMEEKPDENV